MKSQKLKAIAFLFTIASILTLNSCKKGDEDPLLSLRSRNARLEGEWKMTSGERTNSVQADASSPAIMYTFTFTSNVYTISAWGDSEKGTHSLSYIFSKDGTYEMNLTMDGVELRVEGVWSWLYKNKELELKNKEAIQLTGHRYFVDGVEETTYSGNTVVPDAIYVVRKLKNDEMIFDYLMNQKDQDGELDNVSGHFVFEKQ